MEQVINQLNALKEFKPNDTTVDNYIAHVEQYVEQLKQIKGKNQPLVDTIKEITAAKKKVKTIQEFMFDYAIIQNLLKDQGINIPMKKLKKYLQLM